MQTITYPENNPFGATVVAIGNFDGVHAGHRFLLQQARHYADGMRLPLVVLTFEPHPREVLFPDVPLRRLMGLSEKKEVLSRCRVDLTGVLPFDKTVAAMSPEDFLENIVRAWLCAELVVVGEDFRFGHKAAGDVDMLLADTRFATRVVPLQKDADGVVVSSRRLRGEA